MRRKKGTIGLLSLFVITAMIILLSNCTEAPLITDNIDTLSIEVESVIKDAFVEEYPNLNDRNFGTNTQLVASAFTAEGIDLKTRSLIEFDLSVIPDEAIITSASLSLYAYDGNVGMGLHYGTAQGGSENSTFIQRVISNWDEKTVTWNNQPTTTTENQISLPGTTSETENFENINVTSLVQDMIDDKASSFGFMIRIQNEVKFRQVNFCSSDHPKSELHPKLLIKYIIPKLVLQPGTEGKDAIVDNHPLYINSNMGSDAQFTAAAFSAGDDYIARAIIDFDLSLIPSGATIDRAFLSLYAIEGPGGLGQHFGLVENGSDNSTYLQRITSAWDESIVTWNNQPTSTATNQVSLPGTTTRDQNFENIDVTLLVQDMINNPATSFGFMLRIQTEQKYRLVNFCSSDNSNAAKHPKLVVYYNSSPIQISQ